MKVRGFGIEGVGLRGCRSQDAGLYSSKKLKREDANEQLFVGCPPHSSAVVSDQPRPYTLNPKP